MHMHRQSNTSINDDPCARYITCRWAAQKKQSHPQSLPAPPFVSKELLPQLSCHVVVRPSHRKGSSREEEYTYGALRSRGTGGRVRFIRRFSYHESKSST